MTSEIAPAGEGREPAAVDRELRASYEDRDKVAEQLRVAAGDGRLTADELDQRLEAALTARTYGELAALTADLPGVARVEPDVPAVRPQRAGRIDVGSASVKREGSGMRALRWPWRSNSRIDGPYSSEMKKVPSAPTARPSGSKRRLAARFAASNA